MLHILITHASVLAALSVASAAPRESLPFTAVKPAGELHARIAKNFECLHAEHYQKDNLFTTSHDPNGRLYAGDGHFIAAASHDKAAPGKSPTKDKTPGRTAAFTATKYATGHLYTLCLRSPPYH